MYSNIVDAREELKDFSDKVKQWHKMRDLVANEGISFNEQMYEMFGGGFVREIIRDDLYWEWLGEPHRLKEFDALLQRMLDIYSEKVNEPLVIKTSEPLKEKMDTKYAKKADFVGLKRVTFLAFEALDGEAIGARFRNQWGKVYRLIFKENGVERQYDDTNYSFYKSVKASGVKPNQDFLIQTISVKDPTDANSLDYRVWLIIPLRAPVAPVAQGGDKII